MYEVSTTKRGVEWAFKNAKNMDYSLDMKFFTRKMVFPCFVQC